MDIEELYHDRLFQKGLRANAIRYRTTISSTGEIDDLVNEQWEAIAKKVEEKPNQARKYYLGTGMLRLRNLGREIDTQAHKGKVPQAKDIHGKERQRVRFRTERLEEYAEIGSLDHNLKGVADSSLKGREFYLLKDRGTEDDESAGD